MPDPEIALDVDVRRDPAPWSPEVSDVATLLHARTIANGTELGTFSENTRPTETQVERLIVFAVDDIRAQLRVDVPVEFAGQVQDLAALRAATLVEASYFPEQLDTDHSAYRQYLAMYMDGIARLGALLNTVGPSVI